MYVCMYLWIKLLFNWMVYLFFFLSPLTLFSGSIINTTFFRENYKYTKYKIYLLVDFYKLKITSWKCCLVDLSIKQCYNYMVIMRKVKMYWASYLFSFITLTMMENYLTLHSKCRNLCLHFEKSSSRLFRYEGSREFFKIKSFSSKQRRHVWVTGE